MSRTNAVSIYLRERIYHPLVGLLPKNGELEGEMLAEAIEDMWEFVPEDKRQEIRDKMHGFNSYAPEDNNQYRMLAPRY